MAVDLTVQVSTPEFFRGLGINDAEALEALSILMHGETCDLGSLQRLRDLVLYGCFRIEPQLRDALFNTYGADVFEAYCAPGIEALVALRGYHTVPTRDVEKYCPGAWHGFAQSLEPYLGRRVPEWFYPALVKLARECTSHNFGDKLHQAFVVWQMAGDPLDVGFRAVLRILEAARSDFRDSAEDTGNWVIILPVEDDSCVNLGSEDC